MILATKIIALRKKNGWTQEDLAEQMHVSRQAISKWESARSLPDLTRIIEMSKLFGVSTDVLLRDDLDIGAQDSAPTDHAESDSGVRTRLVGLEEATAYLDDRRSISGRVAAGVACCVLAGIPVIAGDPLVSGLGITSVDGSVVGVMIALIMVAGAVVAFLSIASHTRAFRWVKDGGYELGYGVDGAVEERYQREQPAYQRSLVWGVLFCIAAGLWVLGTSLLPDTTPDNDAREVALLCGAIATVACGVYLLVRRGMCTAAYDELTRDATAQRAKGLHDTVNTVYWSVALVLYFGYSFLVPGAWGYSWLIWPIAAIAYGAVTAIVEAVARPKR
ncbi:helix-turn-helix transcriptional regulator [Nanchangia anserum]|uniref:Helix-turn-helix transcriptional regulator n=1 Tax=Nanchangia anserum TaxID=2692125 RepID=A0A8I0KQM3_9ACTO|nr:helix-turn-helix transcriptional regulator [Nanchangia anserum]MBD3690140.1 helix-turn-helix transcriptional regulator [Nanchangia anserum]QOX82080.1 helix-turn-helix transcriptional regulator [Nanchangia anserum]